MKDLIATFLIAVFSFSAWSQTPDWEWGRQATDGFGSSYGWSTAVDLNSNIYATGIFNDDTLIFESDTIINPSAFITMFIVKYDFLENYKWVRHASSYTNGSVRGSKILADALGNIYVGGYFSGDSMIIDNITLINAYYNYDEMFLAKYDSTGNLIWARTIAGTRDDQLSSMELDSNGNLFITGFFNSHTLDFGNMQLTNHYISSSNFFIAKLDSSGMALWAKNVYPSSAGGSVLGKDITVDESGNAYVGGLLYKDSAQFDGFNLINPASNYFAMFVVKYNQAGNVIWAKLVPDSSVWGDRVVHVSCNKNGLLYVAGQFRNSFISFGGDTLWKIGSSDNIFIFQLDTSGQELWGKRNGTNNVDIIHDIASDTSGNLFVTGEFESELQFPSDTLHAINQDVFIIKYDMNGNKTWVKSFSGQYMASGEGLAINTAGNVFITGTYDGTPTIFGNDTLSASAFSNYFLARISFITVNIPSKTICKGDTIQLVASGATSYTWMPTVGLSSTTGNSVYAFPDSSNTYTVLGMNNGFTSSGKSKIIVEPTPPVPIIMVNSDTLISSTWSGNQWYRNDTLISGAISQLYIVPSPVTYLQCFKVRQISNNGCYSESDTICFVNVGIEEIKKPVFNIYPNPVQDIFNIKSADNESYQIILKNLYSQIILKHNFTTSIVLDCSEFSDGIYLYQIRDKNGITLSGKFIKQ